jgi:hypothetical protein
MADLARHERQNTAYPPQTAHSQNPSDSAKRRPPICHSFLCKILIRQVICQPWALKDLRKSGIDDGRLLADEEMARPVKHQTALFARPSWSAQTACWVS